MPRNRRQNFTEREKNKLVEILTRYKNIIENKKTDGLTLKKKQETWKKIAEEYNSLTERQRDEKQLKNCYDNIKRSGKKQHALERGQEYLTRMYEEIKRDAKEHSRSDNQSISRTGGGPPSTQLTDTEAIVLAICEDQIEPLRNPYDDGAEYFQDVSYVQSELDVEENVEQGGSPEFQVEDAVPNSTNTAQNEIPSSNITINSYTHGHGNRKRKSLHQELCDYTANKRKNNSQYQHLQQTLLEKKIELIQMEINHNSVIHEKKLGTEQLEHNKKMELLEMQMKQQTEEHEAKMKLLNIQIELKRQKY